MATVIVRNISGARLNIHGVYRTLEEGETVEFTRWIPELKKMGDLMAAFDAGIIELTVTLEADELNFTNVLDLVEVTRHHYFQTNSGVGYAGGYYDHATSPNDFSPAITFGDANTARAAHVYVVTGAAAVDQVTIRVTGASINDSGTRIPGDTDDIVIPAGTAADSYFEVKKFNGEVDIETISGTPISCNYGWSKYHDFNNQDFQVLGLEAVWESDSTDGTSDIELIHHTADGWTYNGGGAVTPPAAVAARSVDHGPDVVHLVGFGAWKRSNLDVRVDGRDGQGILWRITSGSTGVGSLSFRSLSLEVTLRKLPPGNLGFP